MQKRKIKPKKYTSQVRESGLDKWKLSPLTSARRKEIALTTEKLINEVVADAQRRLKRIEIDLRKHKHK